MSVCKGCRRQIDWIRTAAGKSMPIDPDPVFVIEGDGKDLFFTDELEKMFELFPEKECPNINSAFRKLHANLMFRGDTLKGRAARPDEVATREAKLETPLGFVPHWKTCPNAADFRRRR